MRISVRDSEMPETGYSVQNKGENMKQYNVTGMSCAACQARVEKAVGAVEGVTACSVNLLTNSMGVEGSADDAQIIEAVRNAGYGASPKGGAASDKAGKDPGYEEELSRLENSGIKELKLRLFISLGFLLVLMYFSMGHTMLALPLPSMIGHDPVRVAVIQMLLCIAVMIVNQRFFISGFKSVVHGSPNMDTLVAMGSGVSFLYSTGVLLVMTDLHDLYFESAAMILTLITVGKLLEARSKGKTTDALKSLMRLAPKTARIIQDGEEKEVPVDQVGVGDIFVIRPGDSIPVDGVVTEGISAVDESSLTGESIPVDKTVGSRVSAATINSSGFLKCKAVRVGEDTTLSQIIRMVNDAASTKAPIAKIADRVSGVFVPVVIGIAVFTFIIWMIMGQTTGFAVARAISVLVISCPCALGLATPVAIMVGNGVGARNGILFKTAVSLEQTGKADIVVFDKTGTITNGTPVVTDIIPMFKEDTSLPAGMSSDTDSEETVLLKIAGALESKSEHPLSRAVIGECEERKIDITEETVDFSAIPGRGLTASLSGQKIYGGNISYIKEVCSDEEGLLEAGKRAEDLSEQGKTPLIFALGKSMLGIIAVADTLKDDSTEAVSQLKKMGMHVVMLTGDNERTAAAIGSDAGVDEVIAGVYPDAKAREIERLKEHGRVVMTGDGINDAPALTTADMGIAIGAGTDVAIDAADVVLMKSSIIDVPAAIRLSRATLRNIHENLFWAFFYNMIGIPLAAGAFYRFGIKLSPMFGAAAMSLSSFCVVSNALRLNLCKLYDPSKDKPRRGRRYGHGKCAGQADDKTKENKSEENKPEGEKNMTKTMSIEGMMCAHCEATVKKALEALEGVSSAEVSHEKNNAVVTLSADVADEVLKKAVEDKDYKVTEIK